MWKEEYDVWACVFLLPMMKTSTQSFYLQLLDLFGEAGQLWLVWIRRGTFGEICHLVTVDYKSTPTS